MAPQTTLPTSAKSPRDPAKSAAAGFTLIELLVVIGILALLAGILLPMALKAYGAGRRARTASDLQSISVALDAYKADFGDYPRVGANQAGAATLGLALVGPYGDGVLPAGGVDDKDPPTVVAGTEYNPGDTVRQTAALNSNQYVCLVKSMGSTITDQSMWALLPPGFANDGFDGPGFKARAGGRVRQPYMAEGKVKTRGLDILDADGNPILYFPASLARPNVNLLDGYVAVENRGGNNPVIPRYNVLDNSVVFDPNAAYDSTAAAPLKRVRAMLGGATNGSVAAGKTAVEAPYLLWSAGSDARYGPVAADPTPSDVSKCDDVTNFR